MSDFIDFARACGVEINPSKFRPVEKIQRCGTTDKPNSKNGAWWFDGSRGFVWNWSEGAEANWWQDPNARPWTEADKAAFKAKRKAERKRMEEGYRQAAQRAAAELNRCIPGQHPYLESKGFPEAQGLIDPEGSLLIPMRNVMTNHLQGVQTIRWEGDKFSKKMTWGMRAKGAVFRLGPQEATETILVEGYATGLSLMAAIRSVGLRSAVLVCFSANGIEFAAPLVSGRVMIYADNDASGTGERVAKATGFAYCMSDVVGHDANDDHTKLGLMSVCKKVMQLRRVTA